MPYFEHKKRSRNDLLIMKGWKQLTFSFPVLNLELDLLDLNENYAVGIFSENIKDVLDLKIIYSHPGFNHNKIAYWKTRTPRKQDGTAPPTIPKGKS